MADGVSRKEILGGIEESQLLPADFYQILSLARRRRESVSTPDSQRLAEALVPDFESFDKLAKSVSLPLVLVELAIIDNESLERYRESRIRRARRANGGEEETDDQPEFVSVLATFDEFSKDDALIRVWDTGTERVVREKGKSIVGSPETYGWAYIWDELALAQMVISENSQEADLKADRDPIRDGIEIKNPAGDLFRIRLPEFYRFGKETSREALDESTQEHSNDGPKKIARDLLSYFNEGLIKESNSSQLDHAILLIVPFTRPRLYQSEGLTDGEADIYSHKKSGEQEGGGVFILCRDTFANADAALKERLIAHDLESKKNRVRRLATAVMWLMHRSAMLEAKRERAYTQGQDVAQYFHMISGSTRKLKNDVKAVLRSSESLSEDVKKYLDASKGELEQLDRMGEIARHALLLRSGRSSPIPLEANFDVTSFEAMVKSEITRAVSAAKEHRVETGRRELVKDVDVDFSWEVSADARPFTSQGYLHTLFDEVFQNALQHGGFDAAHHAINVKVYSLSNGDIRRGATFIMRVANPVRDERARINLRELFGRRRFYLGLSQIEMLAQVYDLEPPFFALEKGDAVVYCCIGVSR